MHVYINTYTYIYAPTYTCTYMFLWKHTCIHPYEQSINQSKSNGRCHTGSFETLKSMMATATWNNTGNGRI